jgi:hypothetical protein
MNVVHAADESQRKTVFDADRDEEDGLFAAAVWQQMMALTVADLANKVHGRFTKR